MREADFRGSVEAWRRSVAHGQLHYVDDGDDRHGAAPGHANRAAFASSQDGSTGSATRRRRVQPRSAVDNDDDDDYNNNDAAGLAMPRHPGSPVSREAPPLQTTQFWLGAAAGFLLSVLVLPYAWWVWAAADVDRIELTHADAGSNALTRRRALFFGLLFGAGGSTGALGVALTIYIPVGSMWSLWLLIPTVCGAIIGAVVCVRGLYGWITLKRHYRMGAGDIIALIMLTVAAVVALMMVALNYLVDGLAHAM